MTVLKPLLYKTVALKNGSSATLDWLKKSDLPEVVDALNSVIREDKYLLLTDEIVDMELERRWFRQAQETHMQYLVARVNGKVAGAANLEPHIGKRAHVAQLDIYLIKEFRDLGLGTLLIQELIDVAKKNGLKVVQLSTFATNKRAMHVYQKCGFKKCGKLTNDIKFANGAFTDRIMMELRL